MEKLSTRCKAYLRSHIRDAWRWYSEARKDCLKQKKCAVCKKKDRDYADHIDPVGEFLPEANPYIKRMFCDRSNLQPICKDCHKTKTKEERLTKNALRKRMQRGN